MQNVLDVDKFKTVPKDLKKKKKKKIARTIEFNTLNMKVLSLEKKILDVA